MSGKNSDTPVDIITSAAPVRRVGIIDATGNEVILEPNGSLPVTPQGTISTLNSTIETLDPDEAFTGDAEDITNVAMVYITTKSDVASATDGLSIQQSSDGVNWDHTDEFTVGAGSGKTFSFQAATNWFRIVYTNGGTIQGFFRLQTKLSSVYGKPSSHRIQDSIIGDDDAELVKSVQSAETAKGEFVNVGATSSGSLKVADYDNAHRNAANSIFGDRIVGTRVPTIAAQFQYGLRTDDAVFDVVTTGVVAIEDAMLKLNTGTDSAGHVGIRGADYLRYIPGHEAYAFFTCVFAAPVANLTQRIGLFDFDGGDGNGFFIGYNGLTFGITRRRAGVDTFTAVDVSTVFPSDIPAFNPTKGNVYKLSYGYLGFATIHFEVLLPQGTFVEFAKIEYPNTSTETHIANANIPLRAEMTNSGSTVDSQMRIGSVSAGIVDGGGADPIARIFTFALGTTTLVAGVATQLISFRNKGTFFGLTNKISSQLILVSTATDGNKPVAWGIKKNSTITTSGTWTDADPDSVIEWSTDAVVNLATGTDMLLWNMARADTFFEDVEKYLVKLRPNEWATFFCLSQNANDVELSIRWLDLF